MADGIKLIAENRKARHDYFVEEKLEAGLVLTGTEVKSLRAGKANLQDSYAIVKNGELWLLNAHIPPYDRGNRTNHEPLRTRKLLVHKEEFHKLASRIEGTGYTLIPLKLYFKDGIVKVEVGVAKGKKAHDKRDTIKARESKRQLDQLRKHARR
jgi:SsrA-binding protein